MRKLPVEVEHPQANYCLLPISVFAYLDDPPCFANYRVVIGASQG